MPPLLPAPTQHPPSHAVACGACASCFLFYEHHVTALCSPCGVLGQGEDWRLCNRRQNGSLRHEQVRARTHGQAVAEACCGKGVTRGRRHTAPWRAAGNGGRWQGNGGSTLRYRWWPSFFSSWGWGYMCASPCFVDCEDNGGVQWGVAGEECSSVGAGGCIWQKTQQAKQGS